MPQSDQSDQSDPGADAARPLTVLTLSGAAIQPFLDAVAALRIAVFREWPYLYAGTPEYEAGYLGTYARAAHSLFVLVLDGDRVVGASTGVPMAAEEPAFRRPFDAGGWDSSRIFYFGESVLLPAYRGRGLGVRFFQEREDFARGLGLAWTAFCAVERGADHPHRPPDYVPLDRFWEKRGYRRHPELTTEYRWRDVDAAEETAKTLVFWLKSLESPQA